jgi:hypothetical protein
MEVGLTEKDRGWDGGEGRKCGYCSRIELRGRIVHVELFYSVCR